MRNNFLIKIGLIDAIPVIGMAFLFPFYQGAKPLIRCMGYDDK
jgi:hypothetical protein